MQWVPFTVALSAGLECRGMLYDEADHFRFDYQLTDSKQATPKTLLKQLRLPVSHVVSLNLVKGWQGQTWSGVRLVMEVSKADVLADFPSVKQNRVELLISKANVPLAEAFVQGLYASKELGAAS
jgi:hypothetical protein